METTIIAILDFVELYISSIVLYYIVADNNLPLVQEHEDKESDGHPVVTAAKPFEPSISAEEMQDQLDHFTHIMQEKYLAGEDTEHLDYSKIDDDERLDDHWFKEACQDAEEKYFDED